MGYDTATRGGEGARKGKKVEQIKMLNFVHYIALFIFEL
jgi:hypothetical protein